MTKSLMTEYNGIKRGMVSKHPMAARGKCSEELTLELSMDFQAEGTILTVFTNAQRQKKACSVLETASNFELMERKYAWRCSRVKLERGRSHILKYFLSY